MTSTEWSADGKYLFYSQEDPVSKRDDKIFRHTVGTTNGDELIYEEKDVLFTTGIGRSRDKKMFFINSGAATMNEVRYLPADNPLGEWKIISRRRDDHEYTATFDNGEFYILTNKDAENFKVVTRPGQRSVRRRTGRILFRTTRRSRSTTLVFSRIMPLSPSSRTDWNTCG